MEVHGLISQSCNSVALCEIESHSEHPSSDIRCHSICLADCKNPYILLIMHKMCAGHVLCIPMECSVMLVNPCHHVWVWLYHSMWLADPSTSNTSPSYSCCCCWTTSCRHSFINLWATSGFSIWFRRFSGVLCWEVNPSLSGGPGS